MRGPTHLLSLALIVVLAGTVVPGAALSAPASQAPPGELVDGTIDQQTVADVDEEEYEDGDEHEGDETGARVLAEWWGLGGEASEAPYMGLVELGVVVLVVGMLGYSAGKRTSVVPLRYRLRLLQAHEWTMLAGTALVVPHFVAVEEWEGLGLLVAILLGIEVASGLYGRHLHRHVIRFGRGKETAPLVGRVLEVTKRSVLARWRRVHVLLTIVTGVVLVLHIVTAIGD
jgi:hypothetical protein